MVRLGFGSEDIGPFYARARSVELIAANSLISTAININ
jgi:hypothetical protein